MSEREANEEAKFGEVLRWSSDSKGEDIQDKNKTPSPPDCLKSPDLVQTRIPGSVMVDRVESFEIIARKVAKGKDKDEFKGVSYLTCQRPNKLLVVRVTMIFQLLCC
jgi:hypothetical protein